MQNECKSKKELQNKTNKASSSYICTPAKEKKYKENIMNDNCNNKTNKLLNQL